MTKVFCDLCSAEISIRHYDILREDIQTKLDILGITDTCPRCTDLVENLDVRQILTNEIIKVVAGEHNEELYRKSNIPCDECSGSGFIHHKRQCAEDDPSGDYMCGKCCGKGYVVEFTPILRPNSSAE